MAECTVLIYDTRNLLLLVLRTFCSWRSLGSKKSSSDHLTITCWNDPQHGALFVGSHQEC